MTACNKRQVDTQMSSTTVQRFIDNHYMSNLTNTLAVLHRLAVSLLGGLGRLSGIGLALLDELDELLFELLVGLGVDVRHSLFGLGRLPCLGLDVRLALLDGPPGLGLDALALDALALALLDGLPGLPLDGRLALLGVFPGLRLDWRRLAIARSRCLVPSVYSDRRLESQFLGERE